MDSESWEVIEDNESIKKEFLDYFYGLVRHKPSGLVVPPNTAKCIPLYKNMKIRKSDVWVVTYPKCGTTWTQEMVWQIANNVDLQGGKKMLDERFPYLEAETLWNPEKMGIKGKLLGLTFSSMDWISSFNIKKPSSWMGYKNTVQRLDNTDQRRFIKSHLPMDFLPNDLVDTAKVIYVARNPKDAMISYYHHHKLFRGHHYVGDLPTFINRFMNNQLMYDPFFPHIESAIKYKHHKNFLIINFEDMKRDLRGVVEKVATLLEVSLTEEKITTLLDHLAFKNFKNNPAVNNEIYKSFGLTLTEGSFIRKGEVGGWKKELENIPEIEQKLNSWVEQSSKNSGISFPVS